MLVVVNSIFAGRLPFALWRFMQTHDYVADDWPAAEADVNVNKSDAYRKPVRSL